ncbi:hypothetical protein [Geomicrobium sp. JCM 19055]|uniref:hypothetical protein n=1 Tax=Geomicrobium sp. JCM 19055 TaxID=1460649 RepID=UPI0026B11586
MDETLLKWQQKLQPDLMDNLIRRYHLLRYIRVSEPVGRRALAQEMDISERVLRREVELFKNEQLLLIETQGMRLTEDGKNLLEALESSIQVLTVEHLCRRNLNARFM